MKKLSADNEKDLRFAKLSYLTLTDADTVCRAGARNMQGILSDHAARVKRSQSASWEPEMLLVGWRLTSLRERPFVSIVFKSPFGDGQHVEAASLSPCARILCCCIYHYRSSVGRRRGSANYTWRVMISVITGIAIALTDALLCIRRRSALWLFALVLFGSTIWAIAKARFDFWQLLPRV